MLGVDPLTAPGAGPTSEYDVDAIGIGEARRVPGRQPVLMEGRRRREERARERRDGPVGNHRAPDRRARRCCGDGCGCPMAYTYDEGFCGCDALEDDIEEEFEEMYRELYGGGRYGGGGYGGGGYGGRYGRGDLRRGSRRRE